MKYQYFIASRWRNKDSVRELVKKLRDKGKTVYSFFEGDGTSYVFRNKEESHNPEEFMKYLESIPNWQKDPRIREVFEVDIRNLTESENVILLLPAGKSAHIEAGIAYGLGKKLILIGEQKETETSYMIFDEIYPSIEEFIGVI